MSSLTALCLNQLREDLISITQDVRIVSFCISLLVSFFFQPLAIQKEDFRGSRFLSAAFLVY
jgi:hypothetical protein